MRQVVVYHLRRLLDWLISIYRTILFGRLLVRRD
jgi:hypothetical protein